MPERPSAPCTSHLPSLLLAAVLVCACVLRPAEALRIPDGTVTVRRRNDSFSSPLCGYDSVYGFSGGESEAEGSYLSLSFTQASSTEEGNTSAWIGVCEAGPKDIWRAYWWDLKYRLKNSVTKTNDRLESICTSGQEPDECILMPLDLTTSPENPAFLHVRKRGPFLIDLFVCGPTNNWPSAVAYSGEIVNGREGTVWEHLGTEEIVWPFFLTVLMALYLAGSLYLVVAYVLFRTRCTPLPLSVRLIYVVSLLRIVFLALFSSYYWRVLVTGRRPISLALASMPLSFAAEVANASTLVLLSQAERMMDRTCQRLPAFFMVSVFALATLLLYLLPPFPSIGVYIAAVILLPLFGYGISSSCKSCAAVFAESLHRIREMRVDPMSTPIYHRYQLMRIVPLVTMWWLIFRLATILVNGELYSLKPILYAGGIQVLDLLLWVILVALLAPRGFSVYYTPIPTRNEPYFDQWRRQLNITDSEELLRWRQGMALPAPGNRSNSLHWRMHWRPDEIDMGLPPDPDVKVYIVVENPCTQNSDLSRFVLGQPEDTTHSVKTDDDTETSGLLSDG